MENYSEDELKTYIVWMPILPDDNREAWDAELVSDSRVHHFWNANRSVGKWFYENAKGCDSLGKVAWDAYYLFGEDAKWGEPLEGAVACGAPVIQNAEAFAKELKKLMAK